MVHHLPDLEAARHAAHQVARQFRTYLPRNLRQEALIVEVVEEAGREFMIVRLETPD